MKETAVHRYASKMRTITYTNLFLATSWLILGTLAILIPAISRSMKMKNYNNMYYMYNWEDANQEYQQNYENQQYGNGNYGDYGNGNGDGSNNYWNQGQQYSRDINNCHWYQLSCYPYYINDSGQPVPTEGWYPGWFSGWSKSEDERAQMQEDGETSGAMKFIYVWQMIMFLVLLAYGFVVVRQKRIVTGLLIALFMFTNMSFLSMWMLADGSIYTDGDMVQRLGFYGQFAVLVFMTNAWYVFFGLIFLVVFGVRARRMNKEAEYKNIATSKQIIQLQEQQPPQYDDGTAYKTLESGSSSREPPASPAPALVHNGQAYVTKQGALS